MLFPYVQQELTKKNAGRSSGCHRRADNTIQAIHYENTDLRGRIQATNEKLAVLQRRCMGHLDNCNKNNGITIIVNSK